MTFVTLSSVFERNLRTEHIFTELERESYQDLIAFFHVYDNEFTIISLHDNLQEFARHLFVYLEMAFLHKSQMPFFIVRNGSF